MEHVAHLRMDNGSVRVHQTVFEHNYNVAKLCSQFAAKLKLEQTGFIIGLLHDLGKGTQVFTDYIEAEQTGAKHKKGPDHSTAGAVYLIKMVLCREDSKDKYVKLTAQLIAMAILGHHGGLIDVFDTEGESPYLTRLLKFDQDSDYFNEAATTFADDIEQHFHRDAKQYVDEIFTRAVKEIESLFNTCPKIKKSSYHRGLLCKFLFSCLIDADRYDTAMFCDGITYPYSVTPYEETIKNKTSLWSKLSVKYENAVSMLNGDTAINKLRKQISDSCLKKGENETGIYTLNCPTGSGKTLASFRFALRHALIQHKDRIFYVIPYIAITDQNAKAIRTKLDLDPDDIDILAEIHSGTAASEPLVDNNKLIHNAEEEEAGLKKTELLTERLDAPIVMITMVRFLNTFFAAGTRNSRAIHNFANGVIIFDEIQALSPKFYVLFNNLVMFLEQTCHTTIILSTATKPLLDKLPGTLSEKSLRLSKDAEISGCNTDKMFEAFKRTVICDLRRLPDGYSAAELADLFVKYAVSDGNALLVMNTKRSARDVYDTVKETLKLKGLLDEYKLYILTTNLYPAQRKKRIKEIKTCLDNKEKIMVISTQLIEAGVDVSFKNVFRALAGLDSVIQTAGRCNRNGEMDSYGKVILVNPNFEYLGSLQEIKIGRDTLLTTMAYIGEHKPLTLDSRTAINIFFDNYQSKRENEMKYPFKYKGNKNLQMFDLLASNDDMVVSAKNNLGINDKCRGEREVKIKKLADKIVLNQSFKTAARNFQAIATYGKDVIVADGKGKILVDKLRLTKDNITKSRLLRRAGEYMVNLSDGRLENLVEAGAANYDEEIGQYILDSDYYSPEYGVSEERVTMSNNIF